jgi:hypothetical protein
MLSATSLDFAWKVIIEEAFNSVFDVLDKPFHNIFELCSVDNMLKS